MQAARVFLHDQSNNVGGRKNFLSLSVGDLDLERFLVSHHQFDGIQSHNLHRLNRTLIAASPVMGWFIFSACQARE